MVDGQLALISDEAWGTGISMATHPIASKKPHTPLDWKGYFDVRVVDAQSAYFQGAPYITHT